MLSCRGGNVVTNQLLERIRDRSARVTVVGLGYVGTPALRLVGSKGFDARGLDIDEELVDRLKGDGLLATTDPEEALRGADVVLVCVPTPVDKNRTPDYRAVESATRAIAPFLEGGALYVLESTVAPGAVEGIVLPLLDADVPPLVAHCPERIDPGNREWDVHNIPRVVGGTTMEATEAAAAFYESLLGSAKVKRMSSVRAAEAVKVVENTFRDVNIAFVNELALGFEKLGLDVIEVIDGAATKPFGFMAHWPGCGVGGHCIPVDPYYLIEEASSVGFDHRLLRLAREVNESMPAYTAGLVEAALEAAGVRPEEATVGVLGVAYKPGVPDARESPSSRIIEALPEGVSGVRVFDPLLPRLSNVGSVEEALASTVVVLATAHAEFRSIPPEAVAEAGARAVVDGRNAWSPDRFRSLGVAYYGIGRR